MGPTNPPLNKMAQSSVNCATLTLYCPLCHYSHSLVLPLSSPGTEPCPSHQLYLIRNDTGFCCRLPLTLWAVFTLSAVSFPSNGLHSFPHLAVTTALWGKAQDTTQASLPGKPSRRTACSLQFSMVPWHQCTQSGMDCLCYSSSASETSLSLCLVGISSSCLCM